MRKRPFAQVDVTATHDTVTCVSGTVSL